MYKSFSQQLGYQKRNRSKSLLTIIALHLEKLLTKKIIFYNKCQLGCRQKGILIHRDRNLVLSLWKIVSSFLKRTKKQQYYVYHYPTGHTSRRQLSSYQSDACTFMFIVALFTIANIQNQHKYQSIDQWIKNVTYIK